MSLAGDVWDGESAATYEAVRVAYIFAEIMQCEGMGFELARGMGVVVRESG
jgi:hypothetical protein